MKKILLLWMVLCSYTMVVAQDAWKGQWIQAKECANKRNTWQCFRKTVQLAYKPATLKARIAVDSKYWLWVNGRQVVFEGQLKRGPTPLDTYYDEVDLAPYLQVGSNTIAVLTWYFGKNGFSHKSSYVAALLFDAQGGGVSICSDNTWDAWVYKAYGMTGDPLPNYRLSEANIRYDASLAQDDWYMPDFNPACQKAVVYDAQAVNETFGKLVLRPIPQFKDYGLKDYVRTSMEDSIQVLVRDHVTLTNHYEWRKFAPGIKVLRCKLPYDAQVTPYIKLKAPAGKVVEIKADPEHYEPNPGAQSVRCEYVTRDGEQSYENLAWMSGEEIWYYIPQGVEVLEAKYRETGYDTEIVGTFECNEPFWNELWKRSARTLYVNMRDTYFDCPDRERALWWGDVVNDLQEVPYVLSPSANLLTLKSIYELMRWQRSDNKIFSPVPAGNWHQELPCQMLMSVGCGFYNYYFYTADSSFVASLYNRIHRYLHDTWFFDENKLIRSRKGDWSWVDAGENQDLDVVTNEWYYMALKAEHKFATQLGKTEDAAEIAEMMRGIEENFDRIYWTGSEYRSPKHEAQTDDRAQALAVVSGLASADKYPAILEVLKRNFFAQPLLEYYVIDALFRMGEPEFALQRARQRFDLMMSYDDVSTVFEYYERTCSLNHAWTGFMTTILSQRVCGVMPTLPGFKTFRVAPQPAGLTRASCSLQTPHGFIRSSFAVKQGGTTIEVTVPQGTSAEVVWHNEVRKVGAGTHKLVFKNRKK